MSAKVRFTCGVCQRRMIVPAQSQRTTVRCIGCGSVQQVPASPPTAPQSNSAPAAAPVTVRAPAPAEVSDDPYELRPTPAAPAHSLARQSVVAPAFAVQSLPRGPASRGGFRYDAFISYRHVEPDRDWAHWLHTSLETFRVPAALARERSLPRRIERVFRDEEELPASANLSREIDLALQQSRYLIVICSPRAPSSLWVNREVIRFREMGRHDRILALLIEGEPRDSFPRALRELRRTITDDRGATTERIEEVEPLAADVRPRPGESSRKLRRAARLRLMSCILGVRYDDLRQRDVQRRRRQLYGVAATALAVFLVLGVLAGQIWLAQAGAAIDRLAKTTAEEKAKLDRDAKAQAEADAAADRAAKEEAGRLAQEQMQLAHKSDQLAAEAKKLAGQQTALAATKAQEARASAEEAKHNAEEADKERLLKAWPQYLADMEQMKAAWEAGDEIKAGNLLDAQIPAAGSGQDDLRGIEWYFWNHQRTLGLRIQTPLRCRSLAISPDARWLAGADRGSVKVWDLHSGKELWQANISHAPNNEAVDRKQQYWDESVAFSPDGKLAAATSRDGVPADHYGSLTVWNSLDGSTVLEAHSDPQLSGHAVAFSPDGESVVAGGYKGRWKAWNLRSKKSAVAKTVAQKAVALTDDDDVDDLLFNAAQKQLLSRIRSGNVCIWSWPGGVAVENHDAHLLESDASGLLLPIDSVPTAIGLHAGQIHMPGRTRNLGGFGGSRHVAGPGGRIRDSKPVEGKYLDALTAPVNVVCLGRGDQGCVAGGCMDRIVRVWDFQKVDRLGDRRRLPPAAYRGSKGDIICVALGATVVVAANDWDEIRVWPRAEGQKIDFPMLPPAAAAGPKVADPSVREFQPEVVSHYYQVDWKPDPGTVFIRDRGARKTLLRFPAEVAPEHLKVSPHGRFIALRAKDTDHETLSIWDIETQKETARLPLEKADYTLSFSDDDSRFAMVAVSEHVDVLLTATGERVASLRVDGDISSLKLSPTGRYVATTGSQSLIVYDVRSGTVRIRAAGRYDHTAVGFNAQETLFGIGTNEDSFRTFDLKTGSAVHTSFGTENGKQVVRCSDGRRAYVIGDGKLSVYSFDGQTMLAELPCMGFPPADRLEEAVGLLLEKWKREATPERPTTEASAAADDRDPPQAAATKPATKLNTKPSTKPKLRTPPIDALAPPTPDGKRLTAD